MEDIRGIVLSQDPGQQVLYLSSLRDQHGVRNSGNLRDGGGAQKLSGLVICGDEGLEIEEEGLLINCLQHFPLLVGQLEDSRLLPCSFPDVSLWSLRRFPHIKKSVAGWDPTRSETPS